MPVPVRFSSPSDDGAFHAQIASEPGNKLNPQVYADHLEETGRPHMAAVVRGSTQHPGSFDVQDTYSQRPHPGWTAGLYRGEFAGHGKGVIVALHHGDESNSRVFRWWHFLPAFDSVKAAGKLLSGLRMEGVALADQSSNEHADRHDYYAKQDPSFPGPDINGGDDGGVPFARLRKAPLRYAMVTLGPGRQSRSIHGETIYHHQIEHADTGESMGVISVVPRGEDLHVHWVGVNGAGADVTPEEAIGVDGVRSLHRHLGDAYPKQTHLTGNRISGFRRGRYSEAGVNPHVRIPLRKRMQRTAEAFALPLSRRREKFKRLRFARPAGHGTPAFNPPPHPGADPERVAMRDQDPLWQYHRGQIDYGGRPTYEHGWRGHLWDNPNPYNAIHSTQVRIGEYENDPAVRHPVPATMPEGMGTWGRAAAEWRTSGEQGHDLPPGRPDLVLGWNRYNREPGDRPAFGVMNRWHPLNADRHRLLWEWMGRGRRPWYSTIFPLQDLVNFADPHDSYRLLADAVMSGNRHAVGPLVDLLRRRDNPAGWWNGWTVLHKAMTDRIGDLPPDVVAAHADSIANATAGQSASPTEHADLHYGARDAAAQGDFTHYWALADHMDENGLPTYAHLLRTELMNVTPGMRPQPKGRRRFGRQDRAAFHRHMVENPQDKTAPLAYADYLEEQGFPMVAAHIRLAMETGWHGHGTAPVHRPTVTFHGDPTNPGNRPSLVSLAEPNLSGDGGGLWFRAYYKTPYQARSHYDRMLGEVIPPSGQKRFARGVSGDTQRGFIQALRQLRSTQQKKLRQTADEIAKSLRFDAAHTRDALHDTPESAVPSIAQAIYRSPDPETVRYAAAWYGLLSQTPQLAVFHVGRAGPDSVYKLHLSGSGEDIRAKLDRHGMHSRVLMPKGDGFDVLVFDKARRLRPRVAEFARAHGLVAEESLGRGEIMGGANQADARDKYRKVIEKYEGGPIRTSRGGKPRRYSREMVEGFHRQMLASPNDKLIPQVYADHLEESGKPTIASIVRGHASGEHGGVEGHDPGAYYYGHHAVRDDRDEFSVARAHLDDRAYLPGEWSAKVYYDPSNAAPDGVAVQLRQMSLGVEQPGHHFSWVHYPRRGPGIGGLMRQLAAEGVHIEKHSYARKKWKKRRKVRGYDDGDWPDYSVPGKSGSAQLARRGPRRYSRDDETAFHRNIIERPEDKVRSLAYADYLDETGKPAHAAVVHSHFERPGVQPYSPAYTGQVSWLRDTRYHPQLSLGTSVVYSHGSAGDGMVHVGVVIPIHGTDQYVSYAGYFPRDEAPGVVDGLEAEGAHVSDQDREQVGYPSRFRYGRRGSPRRFSYANAEGFIRNIESDPGNHINSLAFADWLEENSMPARAEYIRRAVERKPAQAGINPRAHKDWNYSMSDAANMGHVGLTSDLAFPMPWHGNGDDYELRWMIDTDPHESQDHLDLLKRIHAEGVTPYTDEPHSDATRFGRRKKWKKRRKVRGYDDGDWPDYSVPGKSGPAQLARRGPRRFSMETSADFHRTIAAQPKNALHHLVYADYLEERGMPHMAEVIRRAAENPELHIHHNPHAEWTYNPPGGGVYASNHPHREGVDGRSTVSAGIHLHTGGVVTYYVPSINRADADRLANGLRAEGLGRAGDPNERPRPFARPRRFAMADVTSDGGPGKGLWDELDRLHSVQMNGGVNQAEANLGPYHLQHHILADYLEENGDGRHMIVRRDALGKGDWETYTEVPWEELALQGAGMTLPPDHYTRALAIMSGYGGHHTFPDGTRLEMTIVGTIHGSGGQAQHTGDPFVHLQWDRGDGKRLDCYATADEAREMFRSIGDHAGLERLERGLAAAATPPPRYTFHRFRRRPRARAVASAFAARSNS